MLGRLLRVIRRSRAPTPEPREAGEPAGWALRLALGEPPPPEATPDLEPDPNADYPPDRFSLLHLVNREGSVEHYFHFILGYVAPLLLRETSALPGQYYLVRSCGPLDGLFAELGLADLRQIPKEAWRAKREAGGYRLTALPGWDWPDYYDAAAFSRLRETMLARFAIAPPAGDAPVLIVNRGRSPDAYQAEGVENPTSANLRRSVPNMAAIHAALVASGCAADLVELEETTLRAQIARFAASRTLVAQHGAALVNMLWMAPGACIVEIVPKIERAMRIFRMLAEACGHSYVCVEQAGLHAPVDAQAVCDVVLGLEVKKGLLS